MKGSTITYTCEQSCEMIGELILNKIMVSFCWQFNYPSNKHTLQCSEEIYDGKGAPRTITWCVKRVVKQCPCTKLNSEICWHVYITVGDSVSLSSSSSLGSRCVPWLGEGLSMSSPNDPVLCCPLPYRVAPVFVQVVSPPLGWSPLTSFLVIWSLYDSLFS